MAQEFYYIIQSEGGESIVEYESNALPPDTGRALNLTNIARHHGFVEVTKVQQVPHVEHTVVRVTVKPMSWQPEG